MCAICVSIANTQTHTKSVERIGDEKGANLVVLNKNRGRGDDVGSIQIPSLMCEE
jgi:hypothetical protein